MDPQEVTWTNFLTTFFDDQNRFGVYYADAIEIINPENEGREINVDGAAVIITHSALDILKFLERLGVCEEFQAAVLVELGSRPPCGTHILDAEAIAVLTEDIIMGIYQIEEAES